VKDSITNKGVLPLGSVSHQGRQDAAILIVVDLHPTYYKTVLLCVGFLLGLKFGSTETMSTKEEINLLNKISPVKGILRRTSRNSTDTQPEVELTYANQNCQQTGAKKRRQKEVR